MSAGIIGRRVSHRRNPRHAKAPPLKATPIRVTDSIVTGAAWTISFNQSVVLRGLPRYLGTGDVAPVAATAASPTTIIVTYPAGSTLTAVTIPFEDPAVRNAAGGYVAPTTLAA